jgi:hypothetical protein
MAETPINFNVLLFNNGTNDIPFSYTGNFSSDLLEHQSRYAVAVTRIRVPVDKIQSFKVSDTTNYYISIVGTNQVTNTTGTFITNIPNYIASTSSVGGSTYYNPSITYQSANDVLDIFSRCIYKSFSNYVKSYGSTYLVSNSGGLLFDSSVNSLGTTSLSTTFTITRTNQKVAHIEVDISSFQQSASTWLLGGTLGASADCLINIQLTAPSGNTLVVWSGSASSINLSGSKTITFTEAGFIGLGSQLTDAASTATNQLYIPSTESFLKFSNENPNGTWTLSLSSTQAIYGSLTYAIRIYAVPTSMPSTPPTLSLINNNIQISYEQKWTTSGVKLRFSPAIKLMLNFGNRSFIQTSDGYEFVFPAYPLLSTNSVLSFQQPMSSLKSLSNVSRVLISSSNLAADGDIVATNNVLTNLNTLTDFVLQTDSSQSLVDLQYSEAASIRPWRLYRLKNPNMLKKIDVNVFVEYYDGHTEIVNIGSGDIGIIRLSFFRL